jgi:hypothetical protein
MPGKIASETLKYAEERFGAHGALIIAVAELHDGTLAIHVIDLVATQLTTEPKPEHNQVLGKNNVGIVLAKMARRVRTEITQDRSGNLRIGEMRSQGEAAHMENGKVFITVFSADIKEQDESEVARFALGLLLQQEIYAA